MGRNLRIYQINELKLPRSALVQRRKVANSFQKHNSEHHNPSSEILKGFPYDILLVGVMWSEMPWIRNPWILHLSLSRGCWHLTPTVDEVPVNPMLDYFENINIVKIIMEFQNLVDLDWLMAGALCPLDRLSLTNWDLDTMSGQRSFGVNISRFRLGTMQIISFIHKAKKDQTSFLILRLFSNLLIWISSPFLNVANTYDGYKVRYRVNICG